MRVEIVVSKIDSPILARRLHEIGVEPDIQQFRGDHHLIVNTDENITRMLEDIEAIILDNPPEGYKKVL